MKNLLLITMLIWLKPIQAQSIERQVIGSTGGTASGGSLIVTTTVGEVAVATNSGTLILTQGYQQVSDSVLVSIKEVIVKANYSLFPNPTTGNSTLEITAENLSTSASIDLYSTSGKLISSQTLNLIAGTKSSSQLILTTHSAGVYFIRIKDSKANLSKTLRIIKQ